MAYSENSRWFCIAVVKGRGVNEMSLTRSIGVHIMKTSSNVIFFSPEVVSSLSPARVSSLAPDSLSVSGLYPSPTQSF